MLGYGAEGHLGVCAAPELAASVRPNEQTLVVGDVKITGGVRRGCQGCQEAMNGRDVRHARDARRRLGMSGGD